MSNNESKDKIIISVLKKDKLSYIEKLAENGDEFAQLVLGAIYFYGINTDEAYMLQLNRIMTLMEYAKKKSLNNYVGESKKTKNKNMAVICKCDQPPDYDKALKWYKMAFQRGSKEAYEKICEIQEKMVKNANEIKVEKPVHLIQIFTSDNI